MTYILFKSDWEKFKLQRQRVENSDSPTPMGGG